MKRFNENISSPLDAFQEDFSNTFDNIQEAMKAIFGMDFVVISGLEYSTETEALTEGYVMMNGVLRHVPADISVGVYITEEDVQTDLRGANYVYTEYSVTPSATPTDYPQLTLANIAKYRYQKPTNYDPAVNTEIKIAGKTWLGEQVYAMRIKGTLAVGTPSVNIISSSPGYVHRFVSITGSTFDGYDTGAHLLNLSPYYPSQLLVVQTSSAFAPILVREETTYAAGYDLFIEYTKTTE